MFILLLVILMSYFGFCLTLWVSLGNRCKGWKMLWAPWITPPVLLWFLFFGKRDK